jgi:threonine dehydrogenase-like Zn-dependent dehydrogenase
MESLPSGWARVRVHQCGLCASDLQLMHLRVSPAIAPAAVAGKESPPVILGHELVGAIEATESKDGPHIGERVISRSGGFRNCFNLNVEPCPACGSGEYAQCQRQGEPAPAHEPCRGGGFAPVYFEHTANLISVPEALSDDEAVLAEPLACALRAVLALANCRLQKALVIGAGLQGLGAIHWLHCLRPEAEVACLARHEYQGEWARRLGTREALLGIVGTEQLAGHLGTGFWRGIGQNELLVEGFDAVIDSIGKPDTLGRALRWTRPGGSVVVLGAHLFPGRIDYSPVWFREIRLRGVLAHGMEECDGTRIPTLQLTLQLLAGRGRLPTGLVTHRLPLSRYAEAVCLMEAKRVSHAVRVVLMPDQDRPTRQLLART